MSPLKDRLNITYFSWYDLVELEQFFCSKRFSQFTSLDGRALIERIRGEMNL